MADFQADSIYSAGGASAANIWQQDSSTSPDSFSGWLGRIRNNFSGTTASNLFNAEQAQLARDFSSAEAQKDRDFQERMSNTAYQRQVADLKAAGLNPYSAILGDGASTPSGALAQSASATSAVPAGKSSLLGVVGSIAGMVISKALGAKMMMAATSAKSSADLVRAVKTEEMRAERQLSIEEYKRSHAHKSYPGNYWRDDGTD